ncbi:MAG: hypothetical protein ACK4F7_08430 [Inhella sp.]
MTKVLRRHHSPMARARGLLALGLCLALGISGCESEKTKQDEAYQARYAKAKALFEERCKTAGVVIHRTVKDVEGIELLRIRKPTPWGGKEYFDPVWEEAAMAGTSQGDDFIKDFLLSEVRLASHPDHRFALRRPERPLQQGELPMRPGYRFIEYADPADGIRYRYTLPYVMSPSVHGREGDVQREPATGKPPRYAFTYEGIVEPADRALWVAGVRLRAIDRQTGEVLGELTRYVFDPGFGVSTTGRWPWQSTHTQSTTQCPSKSSEPFGLAHRHFVDTVLVPMGEKQ